MSWAAIGEAVKGAASGILGPLDELITSDDERNQVKALVSAQLNDLSGKMLEHQAAMERNVTERHAADMASDNAASKNIRPFSLAFLLVVTALLAAADSASTSFTVPERWVSLYEGLLLLAFGFYFGGRSLEKIGAAIAGLRKSSGVAIK